MKYIFSILLFFLPFCFSMASELVEYENHYNNMNRLKGELETLELKKKIQQIEVDIYKSKQLLKETKIDDQIIKANISSARMKKTFNPSNATLLYIIGFGSNRKAVINYDNVMETVKNGSIFHGWKVKVGEKEVSISKGSEVIKL